MTRATLTAIAAAFCILTACNNNVYYSEHINVDEDGWNNDNLYAKLEAYIAEKELKKGLAMWVLRIAVAGQSVTPGGAT